MPERLARLRLGPWARLAVLAVGLAGLGAFALVRGAPSPDEIGALVGPYGALAPIVFVLLSALLGCALVPGPLLAGVSGLLFGPVLGTGVTITASCLSAVIAAALARKLGRDGVERVEGRRLQAAEGWLERHGFLAIVGARLVPGVPDAPVSYALGLTRVTMRQLVAGTAVGAAPRAFGYTALGGSLSDLGSPLALAAIASIVLASLLGIVLARRQLRDSR